MTGTIKALPAAPVEALMAENALLPARTPLTQAVSAEKTGNAQTRIELSVAAQLLGSLLLAAAEFSTDSGKPVLHAVRPLLPAAGAPAPALAAAIQEAIEFSGLFYESHLAEWNSNSRSKEAIMREPQAGINAELPLEESPLPQIVQSQLTILETRQLHWQGQAWPGAALQVDMEEHPKTEAGQPSEWRSTAAFTLPLLGTVRSQLILQSDRLQLVLHAEDEKTASLLRANGNGLAGALAACGTRLEKFIAQTDDKT